jgi:hypothetical protein
MAIFEISIFDYECNSIGLHWAKADCCQAEPVEASPETLTSNTIQQLTAP